MATFDIKSAKRVVKATKWVEQQPRTVPANPRGGPPQYPPIWAKILDACRRVPGGEGQSDQLLPLLVIGVDSNPVFYNWLQVTNGNAASPIPVQPLVRGAGNARRLNDLQGGPYVPYATIVRLYFVGNDSMGLPLYYFEWNGADDPMYVPPHDHRDNSPYSGGFAFACYAPGTSLPQHAWAI